MNAAHFLQKSVYFVSLALLGLWQPADGVAAPAPFQPIYRLKSSGRLVTDEDFAINTKLKQEIEVVAFLAICTNKWPAGLVPIFLVEKSNHFELRRLPQRGRENASDPCFFALPQTNEMELLQIVGGWDCHAVRGSGSKQWFGMELAGLRTNIAGRFDQNTDFRFAFITGGTFVSNQLTLRVEYINDYYLVEGRRHGTTITGRWRREDKSEDGPWEGTVLPRLALPDIETVELYEWRSGADDSRRYLLAGEPGPAGWKRVSEPLCRVWRAKNEPK